MPTRRVADNDVSIILKVVPAQAAFSWIGRVSRHGRPAKDQVCRMTTARPEAVRLERREDALSFEKMA